MGNVLTYIKKTKLSTKVFVISLILFVISIGIFNILAQESAVVLYLQEVAAGKEITVQEYYEIMPCLISFGFVLLFFAICLVSLFMLMFRGLGKSLIGPMKGDVDGLVNVFKSMPDITAPPQSKPASQNPESRSYLIRKDIKR